MAPALAKCSNSPAKFHHISHSQFPVDQSHGVPWWSHGVPWCPRRFGGAASHVLPGEMPAARSAGGGALWWRDGQLGERQADPAGPAGDVLVSPSIHKGSIIFRIC